MSYRDIIILGAGIAGISAGYHLSLKGKKSIILEKRKRWGGLCDNFEVGDFRFDYCVHLSFTNNKYVKELFAKSSKCYKYQPLSYNYSNGYWAKHPLQTNLFYLPIKEKINIIKDFIKTEHMFSQGSINNFENWLINQYGYYFYKNYPLKYTKKYWTLHAKDMSVSWIGNRMYKATIDEILFGAMTDKTPNNYYANEMRYPKAGGYKSFLTEMVKTCDIQTNKKVVEIDLKNKKLLFGDGNFGYFETLISSLPLPELIKIIKEVPNYVKDASKNLLYSTVHLVSLGFNRKDIAKYLWFYIYDENILPARAYSPNLKSPDNVPKSCSSLQFEIYSSRRRPLGMSDDNLLNHVIEKGLKMNLFSKKDIKISDYKKVDYGNVIFDHNIQKNRKIVHDYLDKNGISYIGRFGKWDYLWSDQSLMTGKSIIEKI